MPKKMNKAVKAKWVKALRSGKYKQARRRLLNEKTGGMCCLGVLCDIYRNERGGQWGKGGTFIASSRDKESHVLPRSVSKWACLDINATFLEFKGRGDCSLTEANDDRRLRFTTIADAIEAQL